MHETDLIENDKIDQLKEIGGIRSQNLLSFCSLFIFYLLQWSRAKVCWVTDSVHMRFTIITIGHCVPRIRNNSRGLITYGNSTIVHIPIQTEMLENKKKSIFMFIRTKNPALICGQISADCILSKANVLS